MSHYAFMSHQTNDLNSPTPRPDDFIHIDYPDALPVSKRHQEIIHTIQEHPVVIICGTTGSGKTTQLPKMVYQAGFGRTKRIGITQPRRLAATGMAQRVAEETHAELGQKIGVHVRFQNQTNEHTAIKFMTDGILLAETRHDRNLNQYDALIIDEAHERSLNIDFLLGYIKTLINSNAPISSSSHYDLPPSTPKASCTFLDNAPVLGVSDAEPIPLKIFCSPKKTKNFPNIFYEPFNRSTILIPTAMF